MINVKNLNKYYFKGSKNELHVINNTSIQLPDQGLISFLGHSGSGKTTLLNVIGGLDKATGKIDYNDFVMNNYNMHQIDLYRLENIGYVFQNYNLLQDETVYDNLKLALEIFGITDQKEVDSRIEYALKAIGMYKYRKKKAYALSGGQQQRVSIARALVKKCKIILADEPTGNLDSENTVEVMNILKKISKSSLVLLVTHDRNIANFYSDKIYELKDGSIINEFVPSEDEKLNVSFDNNIYLRDLNQTIEKTNYGDIKVYFDKETDLDFSLVIKNGTVYIDSKMPIKIVNETNVTLLDEHYKDISKDDIDFKFDNSWYQKGKKRNLFIEFLKNIKEGFKKFKTGSRKMKFLYFSLGLIGFLLATSFIIFTNSKTVDESEFFYNKNFSTLVNENFETVESGVLKDVYNDGFVDKVFEPTLVNASFYKQITFMQSSVYSKELKVVPLYTDKVELFMGNYPTSDNQIIIPYEYAVEMVDNSYESMKIEDVINCKIELSKANVFEEFEICGISNNDRGFIYMLENRYLSFYFSRSDISNSTTYRYAPYEYDGEEKLYDIVYGNDVDMNSGRLEFVMNIDDVADITTLKYDENTKSFGTHVFEFKYGYSGTRKFLGYIVGYYSYKKYEISDIQYITNQKLPTNWYTEKSKGICAFYNDEYNIVKGRDIQNENEIVTAYLSGFSIGDELYGKKIVGLYTGSTLAMSYKCLGKPNIVFLENYNNDVLFTSEHIDLINAGLANYGIKAMDVYSHLYNSKLAVEKSSLIIFSILFIILFITSCVFMYFIMRSKMISNIYSIGVYRSIGATRFTLIKKFIAETFVLALMTCFIGYAVSSIGIGAVITVLNVVFEVSILTVDWLFVGVGSILMFVLIIFFGILPIISLLKKTPTAICSKYDI